MVCGPPGSGKSYYAKSNAGPNDLIIDLDELSAILFKRDIYQVSKDQIFAAVRYRNKLLASLADRNCKYKKAWLVVTADTPAKREFWASKYPDLIIMSTDKRECVKRVNADSRRPDELKKQQVDSVYRWM